MITKYFRFFQVEPKAHILYNKCEVKEHVTQSDLCTSVKWVNKSAAFVFPVRSAFLGTVGQQKRKGNRHTHTHLRLQEHPLAHTCMHTPVRPPHQSISSMFSLWALCTMGNLSLRRRGRRWGGSPRSLMLVVQSLPLEPKLWSAARGLLLKHVRSPGELCIPIKAKNVLKG